MLELAIDALSSLKESKKVYYKKIKSFDNIYRAFQQNKLFGRLTVDNSQAFGECIIKELKRKADGSTKDLKELVTILVANLADFIKS